MNLFPSDQASHEHSLLTLNQILKYESWLFSLKTIYDMGSGNGMDAHWWANLHYRTDHGVLPFNFRVFGVDTYLPKIRRLPDNLQFIKHDMEEYDEGIRADVIWSHDSFRFVMNPIKTLKAWHRQLNPNGMLCIITPQTYNVTHSKPVVRTYSQNFYQWTITNLIYMLAVCGFDLRDNRFWKEPNDPWLHLIAYKGENKPFENPREATWYKLMERNCLPEDVVKSIKRFGYLKQETMQSHWINGEFCFWDRV